MIHNTLIDFQTCKRKPSLGGNLHGWLGRKTPTFLQPERYKFHTLTRFDKIFAARWLSCKTILFGTKDNKVCIVTDVQLPIVPPLAQTTDTCGIHYIAVDPYETMVATGGDNVCDIALLDVTSFKPIAVLQGHRDWVFAFQFLDFDTIISASRDCTVKLWKLRNSWDLPLRTINPVTTKAEHNDKVRCLEIDRVQSKFFTVSSDLSCKVWDSLSMNVIRTISLTDTSDLVCCAVDKTSSLIAVGSGSGTILMDPRVSTPVISKIRVQDSNWGIRSAAFHYGILTTGTGGGLVGFYDLRFLNPTQLHSYQCSRSQIIPSDLALLHHPINDVPQAAMVLEYDPSDTKLFVGGGPLQIGFCGCYASVWG
ncbi:DDB1- and CUL4-associated factor 12 [Pelomyxa schiedti]|nr:DDB1- and CUL4-associated factor 12 [Pelomyxa schiedti]